MKIRTTELIKVIYGAAFLGSGGGGKIESGKKFLIEIRRLTKYIELITFPLEKKDQDRLALVVCDIGSINAFDPRQSKALLYAFDKISYQFRDLGRISALFPIETGPENTMAPFIIAAHHNIPVVDGDGAGRAVPTLPLTSFSSGGVKNWSPVAISNGSGDSMMVSSKKFLRQDKILRSVAHLDIFSDSASLAMWPDLLKSLGRKCVKGSITNAFHCGQLLKGIQSNNEKLIAKSLTHVNEHLMGYLIGMGPVIFKEDSEEGGFNFSVTEIKNFLSSSVMTVIAQNENLLAYDGNKSEPAAIAPDSICYLRCDFAPLTNSEIPTRKRQSEAKPIFVYIIGVVAHKELYSKELTKRFRSALLELGYAGKMPIEQQNVMQLGSLLLKLKNEYDFDIYKV